MEYSRIAQLELPVSKIGLGCWAFGGDSWWGPQNDHDSLEVLDQALKSEITLIDTAPVYGRGRSETIIGNFLRKRKVREKVILATKLGLAWEGPNILHDLSEKRMRQELDASRRRLCTDYFDIYQVHWPDPNIPIGETAQVMHEFYQKGIIKAVGVSNYSVDQMEEFMKYCPVHSLQPQYSMFVRDIEHETVPFCVRHNIAIFAYAPLYSGLLTGKFFLNGEKIPDDTNRKMKRKDLEEPLFSVNRAILQECKEIACGYGKSLTQLVINWTSHQEGISSVLVGSRSRTQICENAAGAGWEISESDQAKIDTLLRQRQEKIKSLR
ncbi:MAG: aldo/keto reductase [Candidatus Omnitrophica bacterium]|nr:aldo/keto reductase [Candidatus Omnitrophota bacterium]